MLISAKESWCELPCLLVRLKRFVFIIKIYQAYQANINMSTYPHEYVWLIQTLRGLREMLNFENNGYQGPYGRLYLVWKQYPNQYTIKLVSSNPLLIILNMRNNNYILYICTEWKKTIPGRHQGAVDCFSKLSLNARCDLFRNASNSRVPARSTSRCCCLNPLQ